MEANHLKETLDTFNLKIAQLGALDYASSMMFWDASTGAPKSGVTARSNTIGVLSGFYHAISTDAVFKETLDELALHDDELTEVQRALRKHFQKEYDKISKIPASEYEAFQAHIATSAMVWEEAKEKSDFEHFKPYLETTITTLKKFATYRGYEGHPYNLYIDDFEPGMTVAQLDQFFETLKLRLVPLLNKIMQRERPDNSLLKQSFKIEKQKEISEMLLDRIGFDRTRGMFKESVHPFTMGIAIDDVRLTSHFYENDLLSAMLSTVHEGGHGIYEQNIDHKLSGTPLSTGASNAFHESQSRIYENNFFKSDAFLAFLFPILQSKYPENLQDADFETFLRAVNRVEPSLIRIEADELTYALHILVRYELELGLISGTQSVAELPKAWYDKMKEYLGVTPTRDSEGVLQDVHWAEALFGYFPTYALGSAYAAQLFHYMKKEINVDEHLRKGDFEPITKWLNEKVHQHGALYEPTVLIEKITGERLNASYYCDYLEQKYTKIYQL